MLIDDEVEEYIKNLKWREDTPDIHKTLVAGNIRAFYGWLKDAQQSLLDNGVMEIAVERQRQISEEGWTAEHDDQHRHGELCAAAAVYALTPKQRFLVSASRFWPWDMAWLKPGNRLRELQKAGALIAAEIARLKRQHA